MFLETMIAWAYLATPYVLLAVGILGILMLVSRVMGRAAGSAARGA